MREQIEFFGHIESGSLARMILRCCVGAGLGYHDRFTVLKQRVVRIGKRCLKILASAMLGRLKKRRIRRSAAGLR